jgi:hypothetical protein
VATRSGLQDGQSLRHIGLQVAHVFQTDIEAHQGATVGPMGYRGVAHAGDVIGHYQAQMATP